MDKLEQVFRFSRIALDSNVFIYALEDNENFPLIREFFIRLAEPRFKVITSVLSVLETTVPLYKFSQRENIVKYIEFISRDRQTKIINVNKSIALKASEYRAHLGLKTLDAIHLATAVLNQADVFVTADRDYKIEQIEKTKIILLNNKKH